MRGSRYPIAGDWIGQLQTRAILSQSVLKTFLKGRVRLMRLVMANDNTAELSLADLPPARVQGLYVHVPFCFHKCHYCDFYSITRQSPQRMDLFVQTTLAEADLWRQAPTSHAIETVFFGGGTPSLLPIDAMRRLLEGLHQRFDLSQVREWTIEANPATVTAEYCQMLRQMGVSRLSFGAQSFDRRELKVLERHHEPSDVGRSVRLAREAGFQRLSLDLIYGVPGQDLAHWEHSLREALSMNTTHLSCYGLTYEPNTPIAVRRRLGQIQAVEESLEVRMFRRTREILADAGLQAYEISNYAAPGEACRHNLMYWTGGNYIGLGPSAASHLSGRRWRNRPHLGEWETCVAEGRPPAIELETLSPRQRAGELVMLMLRLSQGVEFDDYAARSGFDARTVYAEPLQKLVSAGVLERDERGFRLTEAGLPVADAVASEFLVTDN